MSAKKYTKFESIETSPIASLPTLVKAVKAEAEKIRQQKQNNKKKGYWMKVGNKIYKM